ncbi:MAG: sulfatase-like hydrolase/transferase [Pirellulaceae bacterium]|nr:sulfatase-like hydrolase/transferase [Pirellulaceae bacterium]
MNLRSRYTLLTLVVLSAVFNPAIANSRPPDILFIVADDQRPDTIAALGNPMIRTPNLDRLVASGTAFTQAYAGYPICHVSRAEMLTGCTAFRALPQYPAGSIDPSLKTLAQTFNAAGYQTWFTGKWHNDGQPKQRGYTGTRGLYSSGGGPKDGQTRDIDDRGNPLTGYRGWTFKTDDGKPELEKGVGLQADNSLHVANGAIQAIRDSDADKSILLHVNFAFPHDPRQWPPDPLHRYDPSRISLPANFAPNHPFDHGNINGRDELLLPTPRTEMAVRMELAIYYAMITDLDAQIGRVVSALEDAGRKNTVIIFTSDQGLAMGSHGLLGKQNQYQHSIRSPLLIAGPGLPTGRQCDALVSLRDLFPTLCDLAAIPIPNTVQGLSLADLIHGKSTSVHDFVMGAFTDTQRMIRDARWKLIEYPKADRVQLFDLSTDPDERIDLGQREDYHEIRERLHTQLQDWSRENGDPMFRFEKEK